MQITYKEKFLSSLLAIDLETTSVTPAEAEIIETAALFGDAEEAEPRLYKPVNPIPPEVSAVTYITNRMVENKPQFSLDEELVVETFLSKVDDAEYITAHNIQYDLKVLEANGYVLGKPTLCTLRMAKKYYINDDSVTQYNLPYLRFALDLIGDDSLAQHRADVDCKVTIALVKKIIDNLEADGIIDPNEEYYPQLDAWLNEPIWIKEMPFGKHKGKQLEDVPLDYWEWAMGNLHSLDEDSSEYDPDFAASVILAVEKQLGNDL